MASKKSGLGIGLSELLGDSLVIEADAPVADGSYQKLDVDLLEPGPFQPRKIIDDEALEELSQSIAAQGIVQPIVVREDSHGRYQIIAGERRWRAAKKAGLTKVPTVIREINNEAALAMALVENIQRENLNAIEEAEALSRLMTEFSLTHQELASVVGKSRSSISNLLRLLALTEEVKNLVMHGKLEAGHAKVLLSLDKQQQQMVAQQIIAKGLTVRETEHWVRQLLNEKPKSEKQTASSDPQIHSLQNEISSIFGKKVSLQHRANGKGKLVLSYSSLDELKSIMQRVTHLEESEA